MMRVQLTHLFPDIRLALSIVFNQEPGFTIVSNAYEPKGLPAMAPGALSGIVVLNIILHCGFTMDVLASLRGCDRYLKILSLNAAPQLLLPTDQAKIDPTSSKNNRSENILEKFSCVLLHLTMTSNTGGII